MTNTSASVKQWGHLYHRNHPSVPQRGTGGSMLVFDKAIGHEASTLEGEEAMTSESSQSDLLTLEEPWGLW